MSQTIDTNIKTNWGQFGVLISVFFFWGFVAASNDVLIPVFKEKLNLTQVQAQMVSFAFYVAYSVGSIIYFIISKIIGKDFFQFSFAGDCKVDVQLKETGEHVLVTLTQHNIPTDEESKFNIRIGCLEGWTFYLANLKCFYETGYDLRNKIPELKGVNN